MSDSKKEFLTFKLGKEEFAVEINQVQEIRGWSAPNPLPNVPSFVKGVIDLRGIVVPILDLREKFHLLTDYGPTTVVIVVHVMTDGGERIVGLVVDAVSDVHEFDINNLQEPPDISNSIDNQFVLGLTKIEETSLNELKQEVVKKQMVIVIDIDKLAIKGLIDQVDNNSDAMPIGNG